MRWFSLLIAVLVAGVIYMLVMERESVFRLAGMEPPEAAPEAEPLALEPPEPSGAEDARVSVVALESMAREIDTAVLVRGRTEAARQVDVKAETSGRIVSAPLRKGTMVAAGQSLCEIEAGTRQAQLAEARARLDEARAGAPAAEAHLVEARARLNEAEINDRAASKLIEGGYASETRVAATNAALSAARATLESARSGVESARAAVEGAAAAVALAEKEIDRLSIEAPFAGILETDTAELGALMQPGALCATVIQLDPMKLVGFLPEREVEKVAPGAAAGARLVSGREVSGAVTFLSRSADPQTRTFRVEVEVPNADFALRDGQTAEIAIAAAGQVAHLVPPSALTLDDSGQLGLRLVAADPEKGDVAAFAPVELLRDTERGVWVSGLPDRAVIITIGQEYVTDGVPLDVTLRETVTQ